MPPVTDIIIKIITLKVLQKKKKKRIYSHYHQILSIVQQLILTKRSHIMLFLIPLDIESCNT